MSRFGGKGIRCSVYVEQERSSHRQFLSVIDATDVRTEETVCHASNDRKRKPAGESRTPALEGS